VLITLELLTAQKPQLMSISNFPLINDQFL